MDRVRGNMIFNIFYRNHRILHSFLEEKKRSLKEFCITCEISSLLYIIQIHMLHSNLFSLTD